jgi:hypothetical protein
LAACTTPAIDRASVVNADLDPDTLHPAVVQLHSNLGAFVGSCSGTLIDPQTVITASHCVSYECESCVNQACAPYLSQPEDIEVIITPSGLTDTEDTVHLGVARVTMHPAYRQRLLSGSFSSAVNDMAVLRLERTVTEVDPTPLFAGEVADALQSQGRIVGFGHPEDPLANQVDFPEFPNACKGFKEGVADLRTRRSGPVTIDAVAPTIETTGAGVCPGDSGGALIFNGELLGVISSGFCDAFSGMSSIPGIRKSSCAAGVRWSAIASASRTTRAQSSWSFSARRMSNHCKVLSIGWSQTICSADLRAPRWHAQAETA